MEHFQELITKLQLAGVPLKQGELLCRHTSFQIGGPVSVMVFPETTAQLQAVFALCREWGVRPGILGAGTNVLAPDQGLDTLLVELKTGYHDIQDLGGGRLEAQAGAMLSRLAATAADLGLTGLEFAHGIPGTVGGGVYMNAGAYGGEMRQVVERVTAMDFSGNLLEIPAQELDLSYRHSRFMTENLVILSATVQLEAGDKAAIQAAMKDLMGRRRASQPLEFPSAGSTFKRPATGYAAALIEQAGLKGFRVGGAQVSEKHAGFVINRGRATCGDVLTLMEEVSQRVYDHSGVRLEPEVRILEVAP
jgi:UDP-N-acetylmuramate dehydrogenase